VFSNPDVLFVDVTAATTTNGTVTTMVDSENKVFVKVSPNNGEETTTTITMTGIKTTEATFMKYRLNGGQTPENDFGVLLKYTVNGKDCYMHFSPSVPMQSADNLAERHSGWVVARANYTSPLGDNGHKLAKGSQDRFFIQK
jgi:hypothetical protein